MATETWGLLPKSQEDPEKIEEAIARIVKEHNEDEEAHLGPGQSLQSHKASEVIDHLVESIVTDKIRMSAVSLEKLNLGDYTLTVFESLDGWETKKTTGNSKINYNLGNLYLATGATSGDYAKIFNDGLSLGGLNGSIDSLYETCFAVQLLSLSNAEIIAAVGDAGTFWGQDDGTACAYGFKVIDGVLKAFCCTNDDLHKLETQTTISGINLTGLHKYRAILTADQRVDYYVDGVFKVSISTNLPTGKATNGDLVFGIKTTEEECKEFYVRYGLFTQKI